MGATKNISLRTLIIIILLVLSGVIYLFLRNDVIVLHAIFRRLGWVISNDLVANQNSSWPMKVLAYNIPELLWIIALMLSLKPIVWPVDGMNKYLDLIVIISFMALEVFQFIQLTSGTFDVMDIAMVVLGVLISRLLENNLFKGVIESSPFYFNFPSMRAVMVYVSIFLAHQL